MRLTCLIALSFVCALAGCHRAPHAVPASSAGESAAITAPSNPIPSQVQSRTAPTACAADIGAEAAASQVKICLAVSPATHPPCNLANSCAVIDDEIARSCALFDTAVPGCIPPKSQEAAVAMLRRYYSALNAHDYATAWRQWGDDGPPGQPLDKFAAGFAHTRATRLTVGVLEPAEGGAGSIYQTIPVTVDATLDDGSHQHFTGDYIARRVNGVDGATPAQLRWHIGSAHLVAAPPSS